jgi:hypothetical protein
MYVQYLERLQFCQLSLIINLHVLIFATTIHTCERALTTLHSITSNIHINIHFDKFYIVVNVYLDMYAVYLGSM